MAVKSTQTKTSKAKEREPIAPEILEDEVLPISSKIKGPIDIEEVEEDLPVIPLEDKADPLAVDVETDEFAGDELGLDDEVIDPFGDKWES